MTGRYVVVAGCWTGTMVTTCILQTIGFFSPEWVCNIDKSNSNVTSTNDSCEIKGLLHPSGVLDKDIFGLCVSCLGVSLICTGVMLVLFKKSFEEGYLEGFLGEQTGMAVSIIFLIFQFLAGVANVICFVRYDVLGWSAILFFTFALPVYIVVVLFFPTGCILVNCILGCMDK